MREYGLNFISDADLFNHVKGTIEEYSFSISLKDFNSNVIDPIKFTFDSLVYEQSMEQTIENEVLRQLDKTNSMFIGYFHQNIFNYIGDGWVVPERGYDIVCPDKEIYVEMKNKHNTMNSSSAAKTFMRFQNTIITRNTATCYLVEVISKRSQNSPWTITLDGVKQPTNQQIRRISIDKFYELVCGDKDAFMKLCKVIPLVIEDVLQVIQKKSKQNTVFEELSKISPNITKSIYLLAFSKYEGFNKF